MRTSERIQPPGGPKRQSKIQISRWERDALAIEMKLSTTIWDLRAMVVVGDLLLQKVFISTLCKSSVSRCRFAVADEIRHVSMNDKESHSAPRSEDGHADDVKEGSDAPRPLTLHNPSRTYVTPPVPSSAISKDQNFMHGRAHGGGPWATATVHDRGRARPF